MGVKDMYWDGYGSFKYLWWVHTILNGQPQKGRLAVFKAGFKIGVHEEQRDWKSHPKLSNPIIKHKIVYKPTYCNFGRLPGLVWRGGKAMPNPIYRKQSDTEVDLC